MFLYIATIRLTHLIIINSKPKELMYVISKNVINTYLIGYSKYYTTSNALIVKQPIYSTPCRYYGTYSDCMYGNSCPLQHIDYNESPQMNLIPNTS